MAKPRRLVLDLSHHNIVNDWDAMASAGIVGIIHKASEGDYMTDDKYEGRRAGAAESEMEWGAYHFATCDDVCKQVDLFLAAAQPDDHTLMVLDWEPYGDKTMTEAQAREWITMVEERTDRPGEVMIYSGNLAKEVLGNRVDPFFGARRLWLAQYGDEPTVQASWETWWLWQYSDGATGPEPRGCPGVDGDCDTNSFAGNEAQLRAEWAGGQVWPEPEPTPEEAPSVNIQVVVRGIPIDRVTVEIIEETDA